MKYTIADKIAEDTISDLMAEHFYESHIEEIERLKQEVRLFDLEDYETIEEGIKEGEKLIMECDFYGIYPEEVIEELEGVNYGN